MLLDRALLILVLMVPGKLCIPNQALLALYDCPNKSRTIDFADALKTFLPTWMENIRRVVVTIQSQESNNSTRNNFVQQANQLLSNSSSCLFKLNVNDLNMKNETRHIVFLDDILSFNQVYNHIELVRNGGKFVIALESNSSMDYFPLMREIFKKMFALKLMDVIVMVRGYEDAIDFYTYTPYTANNCRSTEPVLINRYNGWRFERDWATKKRLNFNKCMLTVYALNIKPYVRLDDYLDKQNESTKVPGFEGMVLSTIAEVLNFTIRMVIVKNYEWAFNGDERNESAPFILLENGEVDIYMGFALYEIEKLMSFEATKPYYFANKIIMIKKECILDLHLYWVLDSFKPLMWLITGITVAGIMTLSLSQIPKGERNVYCLQFIALVLGASETRYFSLKKYRIIVFTISVCLFILRSAYTGKIYDTYSFNRYIEPPTSVRNLLLQNYKILTFRNYTDPVTNLSYTALSHNLSSVDELYKSSCDKKSVVKGDFGYLFGKIAEKKLHGVFAIFKEPEDVNHFCAYFHKNHIAVKEFNVVINRLLSAGLIGQWLKDFNLIFEMNKEFSTVKTWLEEPIPLTINKFYVVFIFHTCLLALAILLFLGEVLHAHCVKRNKKRRNL